MLKVGALCAIIIIANDMSTKTDMTYCMMCLKMNQTHLGGNDEHCRKVDLAIKLSEKGITDGFYTVPYKNGTLQKPTYMTNEEWNAFLSAMSEVARNEYGNGDGDELKEKTDAPEDGILWLIQPYDL